MKASYSKFSHFKFFTLFFRTTFLLIIFSQYLVNVEIPIPRIGGKTSKVKIFTLFPVIFTMFYISTVLKYNLFFKVLLTILTMWLLCYILTATNAFHEDSYARTDRNLKVITDSPWFAIPYPFQFGWPTCSFGGVFGMLAGVLASIVESVGDYYACARLSGNAIQIKTQLLPLTFAKPCCISGAKPPPTSAINRGIGIEGIGCILAGVLGTGNGSTSYSENIGAIRVTGVVNTKNLIDLEMLLVLLLGGQSYSGPNWSSRYDSLWSIFEIWSCVRFTSFSRRRGVILCFVRHDYSNWYLKSATCRYELLEESLYPRILSIFWTFCP